MEVCSLLALPPTGLCLCLCVSFTNTVAWFAAPFVTCDGALALGPRRLVSVSCPSCRDHRMSLIPRLCSATVDVRTQEAMQALYC